MSKIFDFIFTKVHPSVLVLVLVALITWMYTRKLRGNFDFSKYMKLPGPRPIPLLGNALDFAVPREKLLEMLRQRYLLKFGSVARFLLAHRPYILLSKAEGFETVMSSSRHIYKGRDYVILSEWLGTGLLTSNGKKWHTRRKMLTPAFHFKILEDFLVIMNEQAQILTQKLGEIKSGQRTDVFPYITHSALDIICESAMGKNVGAQNNASTPYVRAVYDASDILFERILNPILWSDFAFWFSPKNKELKNALQILHRFTEKVIRERRESLLQRQRRSSIGEKDEDELLGKKRKLAFLDLLLETKTESGEGLSDSDIREEVDTFMFEGHDTTAANLTFSVHLIASHPEIQKKIQEELDDIFGDDLDRAMTSEDLTRMKYLESCIKESLRLYPSVPFISRQLTEDVMIENNFVPNGTNVALYIYHLHRDQDQFPNPNLFDPDRFSASNTQKRHPYAYVPFSAGPRNCIGQKFAQMELKVILASIFRKFKVTTDVQTSELALLPELILRPKNGVPVFIEKRD